MAIVLAATAGCEDQAAKARAQVQAELQTATAELGRVPAAGLRPDAENFAAVESSLQALAQQLEGIRPEAPGQQAARSLLLASTLRELAALHQAQAEEAQAALQQLRVTTQGKLVAATRLASLAEGLDAADTSDERQVLAEEIQRAQATLSEHRQRIAELDDPIRQLQEENASDTAQADELEQEANTLRREAQDRGRAAGLPQFIQAVSLERDADQIEYRVEQKKIDLDFDLEPEHELASAKAQQTQAHIDALTNSSSDLDTLEAEARSDSAAIREQVHSLAGEIREDLERLDSQWQALAGLFRQIDEELADSAREAESAATRSRDHAGAAQLAAARAYQAQGRIARMASLALAEQVALLERTDAASDVLPAVSGLAEQLTAARQQRDEFSDTALASFKAALDAVQQVSGPDRRGSVTAFQNGLQVSIAALTGQGTLALPAPSGTVPAPADAGDAAATREAGFSSPEELVQLLQSMDSQDPEAVETFLDAIYAGSPAARELVDLQRRLVSPMIEFMAALSEQFGETAPAALQASQAGSMGPMVPENVRVTYESDDRVTVEFDAGGEVGQTMDLILVDGRWFIDAETMLQAAGLDDPTAVQMIKLMAPRLSQMLRDLTARVRAGEFASPEEALQAIFQDLMGGGQPPMGDMPPMPGDDTGAPD